MAPLGARWRPRFTSMSRTVSGADFGLETGDFADPNCPFEDLAAALTLWIAPPRDRWLRSSSDPLRRVGQDTRTQLPSMDAAMHRAGPFGDRRLRRSSGGLVARDIELHGLPTPNAASCAEWQGKTEPEIAEAEAEGCVWVDVGSKGRRERVCGAPAWVADRVMARTPPPGRPG